MRHGGRSRCISAETLRMAILLLVASAASAFLVAPPLAPPLLTRSCDGTSRSAPPQLMCSTEERSTELQQRISEMQQRNQRRGAYVLGAVVAVCIWLFSVPPDIRRTNICGLAGGECTELPALGQRVASHYATCGRTEDAPACIAFDFSIDPRSRASFDATVEAILGDTAE